MTIGASLRDQQVFLDAQRRKDAAALRHEPHSAAHRLERRDRRDVRALEENPSAPRRSKTHDRVDERGLADAVASEQPEDGALIELQGESLQHIGVAVIGVDVENFQNRHDSSSSQIDFTHLRAAADLLRRASLQHLAEMQHRNMIRDVEHHVHVVLDQKDREIGIEPPEKRRHLLRLAR